MYVYMRSAITICIENCDKRQNLWGISMRWKSFSIGIIIIEIVLFINFSNGSSANYWAAKQYYAGVHSYKNLDAMISDFNKSETTTQTSSDEKENDYDWGI